MRPREECTRREFVQITGQAALVAGLTLSTSGLVHAAPPKKPDAVLAKLMEGNARFVQGQPSLLSRRRPADFLPLAEGQTPDAVIVSCADSRVPPELLFDQGVGDLFVVRIAGNIVSGGGPTVKGSIEYAVAELGSRLIMVLGHSQCGAVQAAIQHIDAKDVLPGEIDALIDPIRPVVTAIKGHPGDKLENAIRANVLAGVERLKALDPIIAKHVKAGELKVVGAVYDLKTGSVNLLS